MAVWRCKISLRVLKKHFISERSEEEKFFIFKWPCIILFIINIHLRKARFINLYNHSNGYLFMFEDNMLSP